MLSLGALAGIETWESLPARVDRTARATPNAIALRAGTACLDYHTFSRAVDRLSIQLADAGTEPEVLVGLCLPRSFERLIAMLAIWKAGGAVLALDPDWPPARLRSLLKESKAALVVATSAWVPVLGRDGLTVLTVNDDGDYTDAIEGLLPLGPVGPNTLAYVVYTSGSTGLPNGVEVTHGNLVHLLTWHQAAFSLTELDRVSHLAGLGFDASFWEVWPALCVGASVVLIDEEARTSPILLQRWLLDQRITIAFVPTVLAEFLLTSEWPRETPLRTLLTGGEALQIRPRAGLPFTTINNYGPSECTVVATSGPVGVDGGEGLPDLGRPIARTRVYVLNDQGQLVEDGEAGEIFIAGAGVARGYRNQRALTQERFVADPFDSAYDVMMYRTGDRGRRLGDGRIVFLGRLDAQEQIRGSRVEPGEVAAALRRHPQIEWCTVIGHGPVRDRQLTAYVLPTPGATLSAETLRHFLAEALPDAMIPSSYVHIGHVPLTPNGKLDRDALPLPDVATPLARSGFRAPTRPGEARLASIVGELLDGVTVGADDNFFLLGGHSLLGAQIIMRARDAFGVQLALRDLFEAPTVAELAERVASRLSEVLGGMTDEEAELWAAR